MTKKEKLMLIALLAVVVAWIPVSFVLLVKLIKTVWEYV